MMTNSVFLRQVGKWSRLVCILAMCAACQSGAGGAEAAAPDLFAQFQDPPRKQSLTP